MPVKYPTPAQLRVAADEMGLSLSDADVTSFIGLLKGNIDAYNVVDALQDHLPVVKYPRTPGYFPSPEEDPAGAWYVKTTIAGAPDGLLKGKRIAIKDTSLLAGVPMMAGNGILEGYVPEIDATTVERVLDAGGVIVGKTHCEDLCLSGSSSTGAKWSIHNPYRHGYSAG
ncbi:MAG: amidase, partial [Burkholderiales bacterium]|nr:amidase [Burkholderiales bacterium]